MNTRTKAWRRHREVVANNRHEARKDYYAAACFFGEKNWKLMYGRSEKILRARKRNDDHPPWHQIHFVIQL
jgi:hypothetical protein